MPSHSDINPIILKIAQIVYSFGLSECNRVKRNGYADQLATEAAREEKDLAPVITMGDVKTATRES